MLPIKYLRAQLKLHGKIDKALNQATQAGTISTDDAKTIQLSIEKVCSTVEDLQRENTELKKLFSDQQQAKLF